MTVTYRALQPLRGDYGPDCTTKDVATGEIFTVPGWQARRMIRLEERGLLERVIERRSFKTVRPSGRGKSAE